MEEMPKILFARRLNSGKHFSCVREESKLLNKPPFSSAKYKKYYNEDFVKNLKNQNVEFRSFIIRLCGAVSILDKDDSHQDILNEAKKILKESYTK